MEVNYVKIAWIAGISVSTAILFVSVIIRYAVKIQKVIEYKEDLRIACSNNGLVILKELIITSPMGVFKEDWLKDRIKTRFVREMEIDGKVIELLLFIDGLRRRRKNIIEPIFISACQEKDAKFWAKTYKKSLISKERENNKKMLNFLFSNFPEHKRSEIFQYALVEFKVFIDVKPPATLNEEIREICEEEMFWIEKFLAC